VSVCVYGSIARARELVEASACLKLKKKSFFFKIKLFQVCKPVRACAHLLYTAYSSVFV
jgi:hypothetical protein